MRQSYMNGGKAKTPPINRHSCTDAFYGHERGAQMTAGAWKPDPRHRGTHSTDPQPRHLKLACSVSPTRFLCVLDAIEMLNQTSVAVFDVDRRLRPNRSANQGADWYGSTSITCMRSSVPLLVTRSTMRWTPTASGADRPRSRDGSQALDSVIAPSVQCLEQLRRGLAKQARGSQLA
jgi:hypothetical protein